VNSDQTLSNNTRATHIPRGVADYFWQEASQRRALESRLLETFRSWGYNDVIPPVFEFADSLSAQASPELQAEMYRFLDRDGSTLALRPEFTTPVARLVGTRLHDWPMPQRFCYAGSVFRYTEPQAGRQREFWQAGVELIGAPEAAADGEVLALTVAALEAAELADFRLVLGQMGYFRGLLQDLDLQPEQEAALRQAIERKSEPELEDFLRQVPLRTQQRRTLEELPQLNGPDPESVMAQADLYCLNYAMFRALDNLRAIYQVLDLYGVADLIHLDLTEIRNLGYYTGITFEALVPGLGFDVASGGRYDDLIGHFGPPQPAVGVALGIDRILLARREQTEQTMSPRPDPPDCIVAPGNDARSFDQIRRWRQDGMKIVVDMSERTGLELWSLARQIGAAQALVWTGDGFDVYEGDNEGDQPVRFVAAE
jgi:ATP phosphoribosyltransferase regulatory subunit